MLALCYIIHFRSRDVPIVSVTMNLVQSLAIMTDKYDCVNAVSYASIPWLSKFDNDNGEDALLVVSFLLGNAEVFMNTSQRLVRKCKGDFESLQKNIDPSRRLPQNIFGIIRNTYDPQSSPTRSFC
jgi:hypothetical protein